MNSPPSDPEFLDLIEKQPLKFYRDFLSLIRKQLEEKECLQLQKEVVLQQPDFHFPVSVPGVYLLHPRRGDPGVHLGRAGSHRGGPVATAAGGSQGRYGAS